MPRRPKGAKPNVTLDQIRRLVATSTAIETGESSEAIEARLKVSRASDESQSGSECSKTLAQPNLAHKLSRLPALQVTEDDLVLAQSDLHR